MLLSEFREALGAIPAHYDDSLVMAVDEGGNLLTVVSVEYERLEDAVLSGTVWMEVTD